WSGFREHGIEDLVDRIRHGYRFRPRVEAESDPLAPQVIPFVVFRHQDRYFLTERLRRSSERRLRKLYSLGIGGHINPEDVAGSADPIDAGLRREWEEEVVYSGQFSTRPAGAINDHEAPLGRAHVGLMLLTCGYRA